MNDMIRCENEANEHKFRLRQIINAQQGLTASLKQCIETAGLKTLEIDETNEEQQEEAAASSCCSSLVSSISRVLSPAVSMHCFRDAVNPCCALMI